MGMNISALMNSGGADWGDSQAKTVTALLENEYSGRLLQSGMKQQVEEGEEIDIDGL